MASGWICRSRDKKLTIAIIEIEQTKPDVERAVFALKIKGFVPDLRQSPKDPLEVKLIGPKKATERTKCQKR